MSELEKDIIGSVKRIVIGSFVFGSVIFFAFLLFSFEFLAYLGIIFMLLAILVNGTILLQLIYLWITRKNRRIEIRNAIILVLINIPISLIYLKIAGNLFRNRFGM